MQFGPPNAHPIVLARTQVSLPKGAFIRALPFTVNEVQRFRIDALVLCADILAAAYNQMTERALMSASVQVPDKDDDARYFDVAIFQHAWSIVDQIYSLRQLIRSLGFSGEGINAFMDVTEPAHILRNRMDHLNQNIPNIAASKSNTRSLFGSLSYFVQGSAVGSPNVEVFAVIQHTEPNRPGEQLGSIQIPSEIRLPIGNFVLTAAGKSLDLDAVIITLGPIMFRTNMSFEKSIRTQAAKVAAERGVPESRVLAHHGAATKFMLALSISDGPNSSLADGDRTLT